MMYATMYTVRFHIHATVESEVKTECYACGSRIYEDRVSFWNEEVSYTVMAHNPEDAFDDACRAFLAESDIGEYFDLQDVKDPDGEAAITELAIEPVAADIEAMYYGHPELFPLDHYGPAPEAIVPINELLAGPVTA